jgi:hypothetical protein
LLVMALEQQALHLRGCEVVDIHRAISSTAWQPLSRQSAACARTLAVTHNPSARVVTVSTRM